MASSNKDLRCSGSHVSAGLTRGKLYITKGSVSRFLTSPSAQLATKCGNSVKSQEKNCWKVLLLQEESGAAGEVKEIQRRM